MSAPGGPGLRGCLLQGCVSHPRGVSTPRGLGAWSGGGLCLLCARVQNPIRDDVKHVTVLSGLT